MKMGMRHCIQCSQPIAVTSEEILDMLEEKGFKTENIVDYTLQKKMVFFEGTEVYLDRANEKHIALCLLALMKNCLLSSVKILIMHHCLSHCKRRTKLIYHTNVMMCLGENFAVICADR
jgi:hypothetical protein